MTDTYQTLELEGRSGWLTIWFNQPQKRNPLTDQMREELMEVLRRTRDDASVRGITLRGRGGIFCAGGDLKSFNALASGTVPRHEVIATSSSIGELLATVNHLPQVVIALVEGAAMAGGFGLACCADVVVCERQAKFAMTETAIGLSPAQIAPYVIAKLGPATARRLMLTAARFNGEQAYEYGFVDELAADAQELRDIETRLQQQVLSCAPGAVADTKRLLRDLAGQSDSDRIIAIAAENFADRVSSPEAQEGIGAFFDKRRASWVVTP
ncbi:MAG: enoyl-CoA hydratase-related protein [Pseudomonadota bacterium]